MSLPGKCLSGLLAVVRHDRGGSAAIFGALLLLVMLGTAAFSEQLAMMYVTGLQVQRFADIANMAAWTAIVSSLLSP